MKPAFRNLRSRIAARLDWPALAQDADRAHRNAIAFRTGLFQMPAGGRNQALAHRTALRKYQGRRQLGTGLGGPGEIEVINGKTHPAAKRRVARARGRPKVERTAFVSGNFNVLHPGHFRLLRFASESADRLIVGVYPDGASGAVGPQGDRLAAVSSLSIVDEAFIIDQPLVDLVATLKPDVVVKGKEFESRANPERDVVAGYGGKLLFSSGEVRFSPQALLGPDSDAEFSVIHMPEAFAARHDFRLDGLKEALHKIEGLRVLVVGDLIVDTYVNCDALGMSQEDPTIVVTPVEELTFLGGAAIVAAHARGMGAKVKFISVVGADAPADVARGALVKFDVEADLLVDETRPTTHKLRYRAQGKTLLRVNHLRQHAIDQDLARQLIARASAALADVDLLLFSDFNYGCLPQVVVDALTAAAHANGVAMSADSQASSQLADISRFKGMDLITPTEREARLGLQDFESGLAVAAARLQKKARCKHLLITLGQEGLLAYAPKNGAYHTDRLPAFNTSPKDVAGAGDALFITTALSLRAGVDFWRSAYLGALAAARQVARVGNLPLTRAELISEIDYVDG
jgi:rfaE bifunctional protein kinase chain/domain